MQTPGASAAHDALNRASAGQFGEFVGVESCGQGSVEIVAGDALGKLDELLGGGVAVPVLGGPGAERLGKGVVTDSAPQRMQRQPAPLIHGDIEQGVGPAVADRAGSGCTPPGDVLPDGSWLGFLEGVNKSVSPWRLTLDLACYFEGGQADVVAGWDGRTDPLEFYPYVRNRNPKVFNFEVAPGATVGPFMPGGAFDVWFNGLDPSDGCSAADGFSACALWVDPNGGIATSVYGVLPEWSGDGR